MKKFFTIVALCTATFFSVSESKAQFSLGVQASAALPMGAFGDGYGTGFGGLLTGYYGLSKNLMINFQTGYITFSAKEGSSSADATFNVIPINVGGRYLLSEASFRPYVGLDLGMFSSTSKMTIKSPGFPPFIPASEQTVEASSTDFGIAPNLGAFIKMGESMDLDITAKYNMIMTEGESTSFIGINAGVRIGF